MTDVTNYEHTQFNSPFIPQRADPFVCRGPDGSWYFSASVPDYDKIILRRAPTLKELASAEEKTVWTKHPSGPMSCHVWAPELHFLDGKWYIYFAAGEIDDVWKIRPYVLECQGDNPMKDPWKEMGMIRRSDDDIYSFEAFSLDSTVFEANGQRYLVWAEKVSVGIQISNLYIAKMESPLKLSTAQVLLTTPDYDWERVDIWVNEGPAVLKKDGKIFLTYSASATGACYCMGMLSISEDADLLDPRAWKKEKKPVLSSDWKKHLYGPGHNSFVRTDDGKDLCIFHARPYEKITGNPLYDPNRHAYIMEVKWSEKGEPVFSYDNLIRTEDLR